MSEPDELERRDIAAVRKTIAFGLDVTAFMQSDIGRHLQARANQHIEQAFEAFKTVDAEDPKAIRKLQNDALAAEHFLQWLGEAVTEGEQAETTFIDSQQG